MATLPVYILDKDVTAGEWVHNHLCQVGIESSCFQNVADLLAGAEIQPPTVVLLGLRSPAGQVLSLIAELTQEPRFARTSFILMGPVQYKRSAFEVGADDYLVTPPDVIELRKRVRLYLDRADLEMRVVAEMQITQEMEALIQSAVGNGPAIDESSLTLLEHAALLTQERNQFETILRYTTEAITLVGIDGCIVYRNPACEELIERLGTQANGHIFFEWPPFSNDPALAQEIPAILEQGDFWHGELRYALPEGRSLDVEMTITPARDSRNEVTGYVIVQRDVAERKAVETLKTRFVADAAVEMRTPVTNIKMREYLLRQAPPEQQRMHLQALERETDRLSNLVEAMLELSRIDTGLVHIVREKIDLNRLVTDVLIRYTPVAEEKGVTLAMVRDDSVPLVPADALHLARAVGAVVENAILYTPEAGHIDVRLELETWSGGGFMTIRVKDTGMGIEPEALPHIFNRFYRSERVRDAGIRGVGLGLAIAHEIVRRHNGDITVESSINEGSEFTIWLPLYA
jgi:two-component system phosphate regulon sensor histidine kinase PhoR